MGTSIVRFQAKSVLVSTRSRSVLPHGTMQQGEIDFAQIPPRRNDVPGTSNDPYGRIASLEKQMLQMSKNVANLVQKNEHVLLRIPKMFTSPCPRLRGMRASEHLPPRY